MLSPTLPRPIRMATGLALALRIPPAGFTTYGRDSGAGVFWAQVKVGTETLRQKVIRLR